MNKYISRVTSSARGELFNPLIYPFQIATFAYAVGFAFAGGASEVGKSSLFVAMHAISPVAPPIWGGLAIVVIIIGFTFLLFNIPPAGKLSGLAGFMLWVFASACWLLTGGILPLLSVGVPNMIFWIWQYLSLARYRREDAEDEQTLIDEEKSPR